MARIASYGWARLRSLHHGLRARRGRPPRPRARGLEDSSDLDLIEANEAFAAQALSVARELRFDMARVNVNGGAIAIGHPIGASGARILTSLLYEMKRRNAKKGLATLCVGGGMGMALCVEM